MFWVRSSSGHHRHRLITVFQLVKTKKKTKLDNIVMTCTMVLLICYQLVHNSLPLILICHDINGLVQPSTVKNVIQR